MSNSRLRLIGIVIGIGFILTAGIFIYGLLSANNGDSRLENNSDFPPILQNMQLTQVTSGPDALSMISQLHGTNIKIKEGYILTYAGLKGQIMIWISKSETESDARQLFQIMDDKIIAADNKKGAPQEKGGPPFYNRRTLEQNGLNVIAVEGMGMENYYYYSGSSVYWIAVSGAEPLGALAEIMNRFQ